MNDTLDDENGINNDAFAVVETDIDCELGSSVETISKKVESESEDDDLDDFHVNLLDDFDKVPAEQRNFTYHLLRLPVAIFRFLTPYAKWIGYGLLALFIIGFL